MLQAIVLSLLVAVSVSEAGVSFIRWGRTVCPAGSQVLYKGYMAGSYYNNGGSGSNFMCVHMQPQIPNIPRGTGYTGGALYGVEFEYAAIFAGLFSTENVPGGVLNNQDMPCVRCYVSGSYDVMVIPARQDCAESGYDLMYKGYLVSESNTPRGRSEFVCLDGAPEGVASGSGDNNQAVIYPVEMGCGSLPCNPFVDGSKAACAVCTY